MTPCYDGKLHARLIEGFYGRRFIEVVAIAVNGNSTNIATRQLTAVPNMAKYDSFGVRNSKKCGSKSTRRLREYTQ